MDVRELLPLEMDAISCAQCCSIPDDTDHSPKLLLVLSAVSLPSLCSSPSTCHASLLHPPKSATRFLWHQAETSPTSVLWLKVVFIAPQILDQDADIGKNKSAVATKQANENSSNLNTGASTANHLYSELQSQGTFFFLAKFGFFPCGFSNLTSHLVHVVAF